MVTLPCLNMFQQGVASEGFVDAGDGTSDELEAASSSPCKRRKEDAALFEVADAAEQVVCLSGGTRASRQGLHGNSPRPP